LHDRGAGRQSPQRALNRKHPCVGERGRRGGVSADTVNRAFQGVFAALILPVAMAMVTDLHAQSRGLRLGSMSTATLLGRFLAPMAGGLLLAGWLVMTAIAVATVLLSGEFVGLVAGWFS